MIELSVALTDNVNTRPVIDGSLQSDGIRLVPSVMTASEMFYRQLKFAEFDVSEMSVSSLLIATARGKTPWLALPIFTMRRFFHTWTLVRSDRGIDVPADLRGRRVGVPEYQQTAAVWARGILHHEFGVRADEIEWFMERTPQLSHGGATGFTPPPGIRLSFVPSTTNLGEMLAEGELDATLLYLRQTNIVDRSSIDLESLPQIKPLFADATAESRRFFAKTGLFPINHAMVVRRPILDKNPWIAAEIFKLFVAARQKAVATAADVLQAFLLTGRVDPALPATLATDPMPYGIKGSRRELETVADWVVAQGLAARRVSLEELFAPAMLDT
jgi:4,5-dihydroxyphthalate decarboxylase